MNTVQSHSQNQALSLRAREELYAFDGNRLITMTSHYEGQHKWPETHTWVKAKQTDNDKSKEKRETYLPSMEELFSSTERQTPWTIDDDATPFEDENSRSHTCNSSVFEEKRRTHGSLGTTPSSVASLEAGYDPTPPN